MAQKRFRCRHCKKLSVVRVRGQRYCGEPACQQARRNRWRREKMASDEDYRLNQQESTAVWLETQGGSAEYYREYRKRRRLSEDEVSERDARCNGAKSCKEASDAYVFTSAKRDATIVDSVIKPGRYLLFSESAKRDATWVEIRFISSG
jgi:hypothetical protein